MYKVVEPAVIDLEQGVSGAPYGCLFFGGSIGSLPLYALEACSHQVYLLILFIIQFYHGIRVSRPQVPNQLSPVEMVVQDSPVNCIPKPLAYQPPVEHMVDGNVFEDLQQ